MTTGLPTLSASSVAAAARGLEITDKKTGARIPWDPTPPQVRYWTALEHHRWVYAAKPRQVFFSTAEDLHECIWTALADLQGAVVRCVTLIDTDDNAHERMTQIELFALQLEIPHVRIRSPHRITFEGGSTIEAKTSAGHQRETAGRSKSIQRVRFTEWPYFQDPAGTYASIMHSLAEQGIAVIETTIDTKDPIVETTWRLAGRGNDWFPLFCSVEHHPFYRRDGNEISDETWEALKEEGFTDRDAAAWWEWALANKCGGDITRRFREYPQLERHMFQAAASRYISVDPIVTPPIDHFDVMGVGGDLWRVFVWRRPEECSGSLSLAIDTSAAKGLSRSASLITDKQDNGIVALCADNRIQTDDLARAALEMQHRYPSRGIDGRHQTTVARIEENGVGEGTCTSAERIGLVHTRLWQTQAQADECLLHAKRGIEGGWAFGPPELAEEAKSLHRDKRTGRWVGMKDVLMTYGMCSLDAQVSPHTEKSEEDKRRDFIRMRLRRMATGGPRGEGF